MHTSIDRYEILTGDPNRITSFASRRRVGECSLLDWVPNEPDKSSLREEFAIMTIRVLHEHIPFIKVHTCMHVCVCMYMCMCVCVCVCVCVRCVAHVHIPHRTRFHSRDMPIFEVHGGEKWPNRVSRCLFTAYSLSIHCLTQCLICSQEQAGCVDFDENKLAEMAQ
jgi:hypothetical protein